MALRRTHSSAPTTDFLAPTGPTELERFFDGAGFSSFHWEELLPGVGLVIAIA